MYAQRIGRPKLGTLGASVRTYRQSGTSRDKRRRQVTYCLYLVCSAGKSSLNHNLISGGDFGIRRVVMAPRTIHAHADRGPGEPGSALATRASPGPWSGHTCISSVVFFSGRPRLTSQESQVALAILVWAHRRAWTKFQSAAQRLPLALHDQPLARGETFRIQDSRVMRRLLRHPHHLLAARCASKPVFAGLEASGPGGFSRLTRVHSRVSKGCRIEPTGPHLGSSCQTGLRDDDIRTHNSTCWI